MPGIGGYVLPERHGLPSGEEYAQLSQHVKDLQTSVKQLHVIVKQQHDEMVALRDAVRKAIASPIWIAPNKDEDM